jgi:hypothetical protein
MIKEDSVDRYQNEVRDHQEHSLLAYDVLLREHVLLDTFLSLQVK